jgi:hypothetical protein
MKAKLLVDYSDGFKLIELAPRYGVSVRTVNRILADAEVPYARNHKRKRKRPAKRKRELKPCGTRAAYRRHLRKGEYPCIPCLDANNNETYNRRTK